MDSLGYAEAMMAERLNIPDGGVFEFSVDILGGYSVGLVSFKIIGEAIPEDIRPPGDVNGDGIVSDADYTIWADHHGAWAKAAVAAT